MSLKRELAILAEQRKALEKQRAKPVAPVPVKPAPPPIPVYTDWDLVAEPIEPVKPLSWWARFVKFFRRNK